MYNNSKIIALVSFFIWLAFIFSAFLGFRFWYAGFVSFFWTCLASLNYRHETTLWYLTNRFYGFFKLYLCLVVIGFIGDYIIGQQITHLWYYPYYGSTFDWLRLYLIIYPFGGLSILELTLFLSNFFNEKLSFAERKENPLQFTIDTFDYVISFSLIVILIVLPILYFFGFNLPFTDLTVYGSIFWIFIATIKFCFHVRHGLHWLAILITTLFMSVFLHEIPNTAVFEWKYLAAPILNTTILNLPLWIFFGWHVMLMFMLILWVHFKNFSLSHFNNTKLRKLD